MLMFDFLKHFLETEDGKILFVLSLICVAMIIDFASGTIGAIVNPSIEFRSKVGINGILRKIASIVLLLFFIPLSVLIPNNLGTALLYTLYIGYLLMEFKSIIENYQKLGLKTELFEKFINYLKKEDNTGE